MADHPIEKFAERTEIIEATWDMMHKLVEPSSIVKELPAASQPFWNPTKGYDNVGTGAYCYAVAPKHRRVPLPRN
jgi:hypothetical protein